MTAIAAERYALHHDDTLPATVVVPRVDAQVVKALAILTGYAELWGTDPKTARTLDLYLHSRAPGQAHPLRGLRQYRQFNDTVEDAAHVLALGRPDMTP